MESSPQNINNLDRENTCCGGGDVHQRGDVVYPASPSTSESKLRKEPWSLIAPSLAFIFLSLLILTSHCFMPIIKF